MATAEQIKSLLRSYVDRDDERFYSMALQMAAREARKGHIKLADEIKVLVEKAQIKPNFSEVTKSVSFKRQTFGELNGLLELSHPHIRINELVLSQEMQGHINRIIFEQHQKDKLYEFGLLPRRKVLFTGAPGTGKTMSAAVLATELKLPLYTIVLDSLITRYMGETAAKLRLIFDHIKQSRAVYLFDEFDAIGTQRGSDNDVGEIRRVLNSFLLFVEQDSSESIIVAATNHPELLDRALHRRFDDIIKFTKPGKVQIQRIIENRLAVFSLGLINWTNIIEEADGLSAAELTSACQDAAKESIFHHNSFLSSEILLKAIKYRKSSIL
jgi:SpoVK/Ycf46/Vps4 family AAA+-type ATPase